MVQLASHNPRPLQHCTHATDTFALVALWLKHASQRSWRNGSLMAKRFIWIGGQGVPEVL